MKILHIIPNLKKGGAERLVTDIVRELALRKGIEVRLVIFKNEIEYEIEDIKHLVYIIPSSIQLHLLRKNKYQIDKIKKFLEDYQPDIIHSHLFEADLVSRWCYVSKAKWFSHAHCNTKEVKKQSLLTSFSKKTLINYYVYQTILKLYKRCKNNFITISKYTSNYYIDNLPYFKNNITYMPNAISIKNFSNERNRDINRNQIQLVSVGTLNENKNQLFQIEVANELQKRGINFELKIVGEGVTRNLLEQKIVEYKLENNIQLVGKTDNVCAYLTQADIFIHTSKYEPFGLVILEAMASGLPVITLDGGGSRELVHDGLNGYVLNERNPATFTDVIINLFNNKLLYKQISIYAKNYATNFDINHYCDNLINLYSS